MSTLKFAEVHNLVAFLSKPIESEGFEQIVNFLNANPIKEAQLQALVDGNKVIITGSTIRRDLQLKDVEGVDFLPNAAIFKQLTLMGYEKLSEKLTFYKAFFSSQWKFLIHTILQCISAKTAAWNNFSSTMTSAIICLSTNQKFNFSKYIFESMVKNLDSVTKILMYPRKRLFWKGNTIISNNDGTSSGGNRKTKDTKLPQTSVPTSVANEAVNEEMDDSLERAATTATSLDAEQDRGNIFKTQSKATHNEPGSQGTSSGGGLRCQETMRDVVAQTRSERVSKISNDPLLVEVNTSRSGEDSLKLNELMELCTNLQNMVLDLETIKTFQAMKSESLKRRVTKLENKQRSRIYKLKRLYKVGLSARVESSNDEGLGEEDASKQGRISDIDADDDITLVSKHDEQMFDANQDLGGEDVFVAQQDENVVEKEVDVAQVQVTTVAITRTILIDEASLAQALAELKHAKPKTKAKGIVFHEPEESTTTTAIPKPKLQKAEAKITQEGSLKRAGDELEQERSKKQKVEDNKESEELKKCLEIILDDGDKVTVDATPLSSKSLTIVDYKNYQEGKKAISNFQS
nr:synaptobrevin, longin-like domain protein [Tanacetum cinerariifolium]